MSYTPQSKQMLFHRCNSDIVLFGGSAGGGKSAALLTELLRYVHIPDYEATIFRRTSPQLIASGSLWDSAFGMYKALGGIPKMQPPRRFVWPGGGKITFSHLQRESTVHDWQGSEVHTLCFDELTHFEESQFVYMLSRNRSTIGIKPRVLCTTNPDANSWVRRLVQPYLDEDGYCRADMSGVEMYLSTEEETGLVVKPERQTEDDKTFTFINASIYDNQVIMDANPEYLANLKNLNRVDRARLLDGNWYTDYTSGSCFNRSDFTYADVAERQGVISVGFDLAATEDTVGEDPDYTAWCILQVKKDSRITIHDCDQKRMHVSTLDDFIESKVVQAKAIANDLGAKFYVCLEIEPGGAGKREFYRRKQSLSGYPVLGIPAHASKLSRANHLMIDAGNKNIELLKGRWNDRYVQHMHAIPEGKHDDMMDATVIAHTIKYMGQNKTKVSKYI